MGNLDAYGVVITGVLPAGTRFNGALSTQGWSESPSGSGVFTLPVGTVARGDSGSVVFAVDVDNPAPADVEQIINVASIADDGTNGADPTPDDNIASDIDTLDAAPDLEVLRPTAAIPPRPAPS
jgi:hypothetical protein